MGDRLQGEEGASGQSNYESILVSGKGTLLAWNRGVVLNKKVMQV